jgi:pimeloyl-[acyl-carrier protein] methyl ester esterase
MTLYKETQGQGKDVVILHGWGCDLRYMQPIVDQLKDRYRVTNVDLPGRGKSDWQSHINTIHDMADCLISALPENAIYIGWSFGGLLSMSIAARYPERVQRFIGIATSPKFVEDINWSGVSKPGFKSAFAEIKKSSYKDVMRANYENEFADFDIKPEAYKKLLSVIADEYHCDLDVLFKGVNICDSSDLRKEFNLLSGQIDLIMGGKDVAVPITSHIKIKELNSKAIIHVIPNAFHMSFWTHTKEFNEVLERILSK